MAEQHPDPDLVLDLALGQLGGPQRDAVVAHVADCALCRADLEALSAAVEATLPAVPRTGPPPGFAARVLDRLDAERPTVRAGTRDGRARQRWWLGVAAAAVLGLGVGSGLTLALTGPPDGAPTTEVPVASAGVALTTADGTRVGTVSRSWSSGEPVLVVDVSSGQPGRSYLCRVRLEDGGTEDVGRWTLSPDRPNSWVVPDPGVAEVEMVTDSGKVWSSATL
ncbi:hypothetical protein [Ornithinimicrobium cavernae]|uniref:hypothetical protein n=1 Tax=Ornithinimicrobium cavernae TaxID=2666047 RepID=UPI000D69C63C|nr:hypothetical protein [Ornithinimicrobium cavernae]